MFKSYPDVVTAVVPMNRINYAQLFNVNLHPPKSNPSLAKRTKDDPACSLGFKISCGLLAIYSAYLKNANGGDNSLLQVLSFLNTWALF